MAETPFTQLDSLVQNLGESFLPLLDRPFACFGHSLGGLLTFEVARWLRYFGNRNLTFWNISVRAAVTLTEPPFHGLARG